MIAFGRRRCGAGLSFLGSAILAVLDGAWCSWRQDDADADAAGITFDVWCMFFVHVLLTLQVYGSHAPVHQHQQRYSMSALRSGEDIMDPDLLAVRFFLFIFVLQHVRPIAQNRGKRIEDFRNSTVKNRLSHTAGSNSRYLFFSPTHFVCLTRGTLYLRDHRIKQWSTWLARQLIL